MAGGATMAWQISSLISIYESITATLNSQRLKKYQLNQIIFEFSQASLG